MDACATKGFTEFSKFVLDNVIKFRQTYIQLRNIPLHVVTETNARFDGGAVREILTHGANLMKMQSVVGSLEFYRDENLLRDGTVKTIQRTKQYIIYFQMALERVRIRVHENLSTANRDTSAVTFLRQLRQELANFRWPDVDTESLRLMSGRVRKATGKIGGQNDDLAIVAQMFVYFAQVSLARRLQAAQEEADRRSALRNVRP